MSLLYRINLNIYFKSIFKESSGFNFNFIGPPRIQQLCTIDQKCNFTVK